MLELNKNLIKKGVEKMNENVKKYQVWEEFDYEGWSFVDFDTLEEAKAYKPHSMNNMITQRVEK